MAQAKVTIGADPEGFLFNTSLNKIVPGVGLIGGTKEKPLWYNKDLNKGFTVQEDNVMVEWNVPPASNLEQWVNFVQLAQTSILEFLKSKGPYSVKYTSQHKFGHKDMQTEQAQKFGCSPDNNAYADGAEYDKVYPATMKDKQGQWRFAGGHIHVGFESAVPHFVAAAFADYFIGLNSAGNDKQDKRRALYGQPGRYRPTSYGIEYRTPSNFWLTDYSFTHQIGQGAFSLGYFLSKSPMRVIQNAYSKMPWGAVRTAVEKQDSSLAMDIINYVGEENLIGDGEDML